MNAVGEADFPPWGVFMDTVLLEDLVATMEIADPTFERRLLSAAKIVTYCNKQQVISKHESHCDVFLILKGGARALLYSEHGNEVWFNDFGPGDFFGEMAAIVPADRSADIFASSDLIAARFAAKTFVELMKESGRLALFVTAQIVRRFRSTSDRMFELSALSAPGRIYAELLRIAEPDDVKNSDELVISSMPAMAELARRVNSTRETVSRTINDLEQRGLISRAKGRTAVVSPEIISFVSP